ncbi:hyalin-like isoform X2 [Lytechinus variegatus]|uniref:hyalin-like isoform X2 n=1 Tax=Lytechinus variegatus TaxID=7654 RepID=UPI001BB127A3|nr:hyalin-like isoform X2 [Lytechinus variegatus]
MTVYIDPSMPPPIVEYSYTLEVNDTIWSAVPPTNSTFSDNTTVQVEYFDSYSETNLSCNFDITVIELMPPVCPGNIMIESGPGVSSTNATWSSASSPYSDDYPILYSPENGTSLSLGDHIVTAYLTDYPNINCSFTVTVVEDLTPPTFSDDLTVLKFGNSETPNWILTASDNSGFVTLTYSPSLGSYFPLGETTVTVTATDNTMLTSTQTFIVNVTSDGSPETTNCPGNQIHNVPPSQVPYEATWTIPSVTGQGSITTTSNYDPNHLFNEGTTKVIYKFIDDAGRSSKCFFTIRVIITPDGSPPEIESCPDDITRTEPAGTVEVSVTWDEPVFNDAVSGTELFIQQSKQSGSKFPVGSTEVFYSAMDGNFNAAYCMFDVNINLMEDNDSPNITGCPDNFTHWVNAGESMATVSWIAPNITDNSNFTVQVSHEPGHSFTVANDTVVSYTATDVNNNVASCIFTVSVREDTDKPVLQCPDNITIIVTSDITSQDVTWSDPLASDNSGDVTVTSSPPSGSTFNRSESATVTVTAVDAYGNDETCTFLVNVHYDVSPVLTCPDVTVNTDDGLRTATFTLPDVVITDDYTNVSALIITRSPGAVITNMAYDDDPVTVTITAEDERGNIGTCSFFVDVVDDEKPVWSSCPGNMTVMARVGTNVQNVSWTQPTVTDNSGNDPIRSNNPPSPQLFSGGTWPLVYTATDDSGNVGTCEFFVTVTVDDDVPVFSNCPLGEFRVNSDPNSNSALVDWGEILATDDSGNPTITSDYARNQRLEIGSYDVEYQAIDEHGNIGYCRFTVHVVDGDAPGFNECPDNIEVFIIALQPDVIVTWEEPTFTDNSIQGSATATRSPSSPAPGSRLGAGSYRIEYIAMDDAGNTASTCSFTVDVVVQTDTIELDGSLLLDVVRGIDGQFVLTTTQLANLRNDLDDLFRISSSLAPHFVGIEIQPRQTFDVSNNLLVQFRLHLRNPSYYNEEEIKEAFESALTGGRDFATTNTYVPGSFDLRVREFRGHITLFRIVSSSPNEVNFLTCCNNPSSSSYLELEGRINPRLWTTFNRLVNFKMVKALRFRAGSVIVPYTVTLSEDSTATTAQADTYLGLSVGPSLEWMPGGQSSGLFLSGRLPPDVILITEVCPSSFICSNGGTCTVSNSTFVYDHECSCPSGTSGDTCENTQVLSREVIIGIVAGVVAFLILLLFVCCCCFFILSGPRKYEDPEYGRKAAPLMLMPRDDFIFPPPPIMDRPGPIITEMEEGYDGPRFIHNGDDYRPPPPLPLAIEPPPLLQIPRPVTLGPQFQHEYLEPYAPRRDTSRRNRFQDMLQDRLPRGRRRDHEGRHYQRDDIPERVDDMKQRLFREFNY